MIFLVVFFFYKNNENISILLKYCSSLKINKKTSQSYYIYYIGIYILNSELSREMVLEFSFFPANNITTRKDFIQSLHYVNGIFNRKFDLNFTFISIFYLFNREKVLKSWVKYQFNCQNSKYSLNMYFDILLFQRSSFNTY